MGPLGGGCWEGLGSNTKVVITQGNRDPMMSLRLVTPRKQSGLEEEIS